MKANEVISIADITEMYLQTSLLRKETRGGHHRVEYPKRDDQYLGWFLIWKDSGRLKTSFKPVPLDRYKIAPERYYMDLFTSRIS